MSTVAASVPSDGELDRLRKVSRWAAALSGLGAIIVISALLLASYRLSRTEAQQRQAAAALSQATAQVNDVLGKLNESRAELSRAQCALRESRSAIEPFHNGAYDVALSLYDNALRCDPQNAYLLNLKAYSLFKAGRNSEAVATQQKASTAA